MTIKYGYEAAASWAMMKEFLLQSDEDSCWKALAVEKANQHRLNFMLRIYGCANKLRSERERNELGRLA